MRHSIGILIISFPFNASFSIIPVPSVQITPSCIQLRGTTTGKFQLKFTRIYAYGKGSEIWPECNEEPILLSASFPGGVIPQPAKDLLGSSGSSSPSTYRNAVVDALAESSSIPTRGGKRRAIRRTLSHLLRSAARASTRRARSAEESEAAEMYGVPPPAIDKGPAILALALLVAKCVDAKHIAAVIGISAYFVGLASWCAAPKYGSTDHQPIVNMPALPSKGHVPNLITNPLGASLTNSRVYRTWLRAGALLGLLLPTVVLAQLTLGTKFPAIMAKMTWINMSDVGVVKRIVGGPMFLLCVQALTEAVARTALLPLPIRILIPVLYNTLRLPSLQSWAFPNISSMLPNSLQILGSANLLYWYANLFLFLIPVGVVRYLRAHFFCVEAIDVTVRKGGEGSVGLLP
mmetsp:Transcript_13888/g.30145  ORF Transcript_13888/g.30145 Transcript_13888/m.30145 type:complete len:405 (-) Transcript_13888:944-2158(-)